MQHHPTGPPRELHLGLNMVYPGAHTAAWRAPYAEAFGAYSIDQWVAVAQLAERAKFDLMFLGELLTIMPQVEVGPPSCCHDATVLLGALSQVTSRVGFIGTASTSYDHPYNLARRFATLDHVSKGRAGWNMVTSLDPRTSVNFGRVEHMERAERYARADEFVEVVRALWDSWEDDALVGDKAGGLFADPAKVHAIDHHGEHFDVAGPLNLARPPQGHPVLLQAGGSPWGLDFAAKYAEVIFCATASLRQAHAFADSVRSRLVARGRPENAIRILPGLAFTLGGTEAEARARADELDGMLGDVPLMWLAGSIGVGPDELRMDEPIPRALLEEQRPVAVTGVRDMIVELAQAEGGAITVRQILQRTASLHRQVTGTPEQLADGIGEWFASGAVDGFNLMPDELVTGTEAFVEHVLPILRARGLFREEYAGTTLRDHLGLARPASGR